MIPLAPLGDLAAHEQQLLARMREHVAVERAQVGVLLPHVAGHLVDHRPLAVHHFVVRERQDEVLAVGVDHREGDLVVVPLAVDRILLGVVEHVVHPAHVPLVGEPQAAQVHRPGDARPRRRFFRAHHGARMLRARRSRSAAGGTRSHRDSRARRTGSAPTAPPRASNRDRASRPRHRRAARRCETASSRTARC